MDRLIEGTVRSSLDGTPQPFLYGLPSENRTKVPVVVALHTWSFDYHQQGNLVPWFEEARRRNWIYLQPNFRGPNWTPEACGSELAMRDIIDTVDWALEKTFGDPRRVYILGASGGGHMGMMMVSHYPQRFTGASVWCGISDLRSWRLFHTCGNEIQKYAQDIDKVVGGAPGSNDKVERELHLRSPLWTMKNAADVPVDFNHGVNDGHGGSVPAEHTIRAFNGVAEQLRVTPVSDSEIQQLWETGHLEKPSGEDQMNDPWYGREIRLRRYAGKSRLTIFDGGHEDIPQAAFHWLACHTENGVIEDPNPLVNALSKRICTMIDR